MKMGKKSLRVAAGLVAHMRIWYFENKCRAAKLFTEQLNVERSSMGGKITLDSSKGYWGFQIIFCTTFLIKRVY
jgi:hypothetical protein